MEERILHEHKETFYTVQNDRGFYARYYDSSNDYLQLVNKEDRAMRIEDISEAKNIARKIGGFIIKHETVTVVKEFTEKVEAN